MVALFTTCKPFEGHIGTIQENALRSWARLRPRCEVLVFGDEKGAREISEELGFRHIPVVARTEWGAPRLDGLFAAAERETKDEHLAYVNADIILFDDFLNAASRVRERFARFLMIGQRLNLDVQEPIDSLGTDWRELLRKRASTHGSFEPRWGGSDYFVFRRGMWGGIQPFALGRRRWDSWLIYRACILRIPAVDATPVVMAIHQDHEVHPMKGGGGPEVQENEKILGGMGNLFTLLNASHRMTRTGMPVNRPLRPDYLLRWLATVPALFPELAFCSELSRPFRSLWHRIRGSG